MHGPAATQSCSLSRSLSPGPVWWSSSWHRAQCITIPDLTPYLVLQGTMF